MIILLLLFCIINGYAFGDKKGFIKGKGISIGNSERATEEYKMRDIQMEEMYKNGKN